MKTVERWNIVGKNRKMGKSETEIARWEAVQIKLDMRLFIAFYAHV